MFLFTDPLLLNAVIAAQHRGVNVRVMLNPARRDGKSENEKARKLLLKAGVKVRNSSEKFALTHQKSMMIDDTINLWNRSIGRRGISRKPVTMRW